MKIIKEQIKALNERLALIEEEQKSKMQEWCIRMNVIKEKMQYVKDEYIKRNNLPADVDDAIIRPVEATISKIETIIAQVETEYKPASDEA